jgi:hypothetical protein
MAKAQYHGEKDNFSDGMNQASGIADRCIVMGNCGFAPTSQIRGAAA